MRFHKTLNLTLILIYLLLSSTLFSQDIMPETGQDTSSSKYSYGIQYYLVNGIFFAFKFNDKYPNVWRAKFDLSGSVTGDCDNEKSYHQEELVTERKNETNSHLINFTLSFEYNYFFKIHDQFDPYIGIGPLFKYWRSKTTQEHKNSIPTNSTTFSESVGTSYGIGLIGVAGIESKIINFISLFIEYNLSYLYNWNNNEVSQNHEPAGSNYQAERDGNSWVFNISSVKIGIILYF